MKLRRTETSLNAIMSQSERAEACGLGIYSQIMSLRVLISRPGARVEKLVVTEQSSHQLSPHSYLYCSSFFPAH